jgi:hypothetical protein
MAHDFGKARIDLDGVMYLVDGRSRNNINSKGDDHRKDNFHDVEAATFYQFSRFFQDEIRWRLSEMFM